jgi:hypothetical protein
MGNSNIEHSTFNIEHRTAKEREQKLSSAFPSRSGVEQWQAVGTEGAGVGFVGPGFHLKKTERGILELRPAAAAIDQQQDRNDLAPGVFNNINGLLHTPAARYNVFGNNVALPFFNIEPAQNKFAVLLFGKNRSHVQSARNLMANDYPAHCRRDNAVNPARVFEFRARSINERLAELFRNAGMAQHIGALKKPAAVQAGTQFKMPLQQRAGLTQDLKDFSLGHGYSLSVIS